MLKRSPKRSLNNMPDTKPRRPLLRLNPLRTNPLRTKRSSKRPHRLLLKKSNTKMSGVPNATSAQNAQLSANRVPIKSLIKDPINDEVGRAKVVRVTIAINQRRMLRPLPSTGRAMLAQWPLSRKAQYPLRLRMPVKVQPTQAISRAIAKPRATAGLNPAAEIAKDAIATIATSLTAAAAAVIVTAQDLALDLDPEAATARAVMTAAGNRKLSAPRPLSARALIPIRPLPSLRRSKHRWTRGVRSQVRDDCSRQRSVRTTA